MSKIYNLKLHDSLWTNQDKEFLITRVPGGWLYTACRAETSFGGDIPVCSVFVPYVPLVVATWDAKGMPL